MAMIEQTCWCGKKFKAREADVKRGWGKACCKKHAARARENVKRASSLFKQKDQREPDYMRYARTIDEGMLGMDFDWSPF